MEEQAAGCFLQRFVEEFPKALGPEDPLPLAPLSRGRISLAELHGESLEIGLRLLSSRNAPSVLCALMCQAALSEMLKGDLSPFHCQDSEWNQGQDKEEEGILLESEPIQRLFLNTLREVGVTWQQDPPAINAGSASFTPLCSVHAVRNTRRRMEDKHMALPEFNQLLSFQDGVERRYYAVFDGHGGMDAATYAATHLHVNLSRQPALLSDPAEAFRAAVRSTDDMFRAKAQRERLRSGSTVVAALLQADKLSVSWLGDSQALLVRQGRVLQLMDPHKPEREDEKQRIEDLGGCITFMGCWRVNGTYAVSRAIGDFDQKPYVSAEADCSTTQLSGQEDYILLACDGFFDAVKPSQVPRMVLDALQGAGHREGAGHPEAVVGQGVAQKLVENAKEAGSTDNITVVVVFLRPPEQILAEGASKLDSNSQDASEQ